MYLRNDLGIGIIKKKKKKKMKKLCTSRNLRCRFTRSRYLLS